MRNKINHRLFEATLFMCVCLFSLTSFGQKKEIKVIADPRLDSLVRAQSGPYQVKGFRIQISTAKKKSEVEDTRRKIISQFPELTTYIIYSAPNYILKVGDFRFKEDAYILKEQLTAYPYAFIKEELVYNKRN